jgi:hypothetical protein
MGADLATSEETGADDFNTCMLCSFDRADDHRPPGTSSTIGKLFVQRVCENLLPGAQHNVQL